MQVEKETCSSSTGEHVCEFCGQELAKYEFEIGGVSMFRYAPCTCEGAVDAIAHDADEELRRCGEEKGAALRRITRNSGVWERYANAESTEADEHLTQILEGKAPYLYGECGCGKTYLACAIAKRFIAHDSIHGNDVWKDKGCIVTTGEELVKSVCASWDTKGMTEEQASKRFEKVGLLVIDDLGKENSRMNPLRVLYAVINARYNAMLPTMITSQYSTDELLKRYAPQGKADANWETAVSIVSRISEMTYRIHLEGGDRRIAEHTA